MGKVTTSFAHIFHSLLEELGLTNETSQHQALLETSTCQWEENISLCSASILVVTMNKEEFCRPLGLWALCWRGMFGGFVCLEVCKGFWVLVGCDAMKKG